VQSLIEELMISQNNEVLAMFISFCCLCLTQAQSAIVARLTFSVYVCIRELLEAIFAIASSGRLEHGILVWKQFLLEMTVY